MQFDDLPSGWQAATLGHVVDYGKTQKCELSDVSNDTWILELEDIEKETSKIVQRLNAEARPFKSTKNKFKKGDVLYGKLRPYLNKVVIADQNGVCSTEIIPLDAEPYIDNRYLFYWLKGEAFLNYVVEVSYGVNMPRLGTQDGLTAPFVLPPLAEQKVIAEKLDTLLAKVDNTKVRLERIPEILKRFRQSVLAAAVSGKLTEEWRRVTGKNIKISKSQILESRMQLWEKAELNRLVENDKSPVNDKWKQKYKKPEETLLENCFDIPESWQWSNLGELTWSVKDGPHYSPKYADNGIPFISGGNISPNGINFSNCKYISVELHEELSKRCKPEVGDILYTKGGTTGIAYFNKEKREFNVWVHVAVLKISSLINGEYLQLALNSKHCYDQSQSYTHGVGNQDLGLTRMVKITIPVPPADEQTEIVRRVEELFAFADRIEQAAQAALSRVNNLTQSILAKAFRGELTADWRAANPELVSGENSAEVLLARIKAERAKLKPTKKAKA